MWCSSCQAEVAAKVSTDNNRLFCASCGKELNIRVTNSGQEKTREAQDLLKRWSNQNNQEEPITSTPAASAYDSPEEKLVNEAHQSSELSQENGETKVASADIENQFLENKISEAVYPCLAESNPDETDQKTKNNPDDGQPKTIPFQTKSRRSNPEPPAPVDIQSTITRDKPQNTNWVGFFGQILAYGGVGILTVGTCMVLLGYFGGKEGYAPQGWLISTVGQMALLLGIVTLVSCGIEYSSSEITNHIASMDERILRIEQAALANYSSREKTESTQLSESSSSEPQLKAS